MAIYIPFEDDAYQTHRITLDKSVYQFTFRWNPTSQQPAWYCSIGAVGQSPAVRFKIRNGIDLLRGWRAYDNVPKGQLYVADLDEIWGRPDRDSFTSDSRFRLIYFPAEED